MTGSLYRIDPFEGRILVLSNLILPAFTLGIRPLSVIVQLTRSSMLDVLSQDYIRTAKAKGLSSTITVIRHALRNALNPVLTAVSGWFGSLLAGAVFIEYIFGWKGIGKVTVDSLERYDFPVVMGAVLVVSVVFVIINIVVDILYGMLDPRIRV
jgi:peptide/nickel transport system permease protein